MVKFEALGTVNDSVALSVPPLKLNALLPLLAPVPMELTCRFPPSRFTVPLTLPADPRMSDVAFIWPVPLIRNSALESDKLTITYVYTRRTPPDWPTAAGRINREIIEQATFPPGVTPAVFVCGPTGFVESVADALVALGHPAASVKTERFGGK